MFCHKKWVIIDIYNIIMELNIGTVGISNHSFDKVLIFKQLDIHQSKT